MVKVQENHSRSHLWAAQDEEINLVTVGRWEEENPQGEHEKSTQKGPGNQTAASTLAESFSKYSRILQTEEAEENWM